MCSTAFLLPELQSQSTRHKAARGVHRRASAVRHCAARCHGPSTLKRGPKCRAGAAVPTSYRHQGPRRPGPTTCYFSLRWPLGDEGKRAKKNGGGDEIQPLTRKRCRALGDHGPAHRGANGASMPSDEDDQDGHFFFNHPERGGLPRCLGARSHCYCCLDSIPPH